MSVRIEISDVGRLASYRCIGLDSVIEDVGITLRELIEVAREDKRSSPCLRLLLEHDYPRNVIRRICRLYQFQYIEVMVAIRLRAMGIIDDEEYRRNRNKQAKHEMLILKSKEEKPLYSGDRYKNTLFYYSYERSIYDAFDGDLECYSNID